MASSLDKLANAPTSSKMVMLALIMGLVGAGWWMLYFSEAADAVTQEKNDTPALEKKIKEAKAKLAESKEKAKQVDKLREIETRLGKKLPKKNAVPELLDTIHGHAVQFGLKIRNFDIQEPVEKDSYIELPVSMLLVGTYKQVSDFFERLGELDQIVNVGDISMSAPGDRRNEDGTVNDQIVTTCRLTTFKYKASTDGPALTKNTKKKKGKK